MTAIDRRRFLAHASATLATGILLPSSKLRAARSHGELFDVLRFGASGDGRTTDTGAIQRAIDACALQGGGVVTLRSGRTFVSGTIVLKPHVELHIENGSTLKASGDRDDFRALGSLIFAKDAENIAISGNGKIDGNFHAFLKDRVEGGYKVVQPFLGPYDPLYGPDHRDPPDGRPRMVLLIACKGSQLRDFTIVDSPTWTIHPIGCENLDISNVTIRNDLSVPNCDGIDIDHCRNVRIASCDIQAGDDCLVLKTSRNFSQFGPCENIAVSNCILTSTSAGIKVEPEGEDAIRMAVFSGCTISNSGRGVAVLNRDGALIEHLIFSDMTISTELKAAMWWGAAEPVQITNLPRSRETKGGTVRDLQFNNLTCQGESGIYIRGWEGWPTERIGFTNVNLTVQKTSKTIGGYYDLRPGDVAGGIDRHLIAGIYCKQVQDLTLQNVTIDWEKPMPAYYGSALEACDVRNLACDHFRGRSAHPEQYPDRVLENMTA